jgi:hypothetical protein
MLVSLHDFIRIRVSQDRRVGTDSTWFLRYVKCEITFAQKMQQGSCEADS